MNVTMLFRTIDLAGQEHLPETNRARVIPAEDGQMQIFSSTQSPSGGAKARCSSIEAANAQG